MNLLNRSKGEILLMDTEDPNTYAQKAMATWSYTNEVGPAVGYLADSIVLAQTWNNNYDDSSEKDILIWNYAYNRPERVNEMSEKRGGSVGIVVSGRFFPQCYSNFRRVFFCQVPKYFFQFTRPHEHCISKNLLKLLGRLQNGRADQPQNGLKHKSNERRWIDNGMYF